MINHQLDSFDVVSRCKKSKIPLWQCPTFLFVLMGLINIASCITSYFLGTKYVNDPLVVAIIVLMVAFILFIITYFVIRSLERLAQINEIKDEFIKIVSHQLRSPLTNLNWAIDFLISGDKKISDNEKAQYYQIIKENGTKLLKLFNTLLIIARIKEDEYQKEEESIDFTKLIIDEIQNHRAFAEASNIKIETDLGKAPVLLTANRYLIKTLIGSLLHNAIVYNKKGGNVKIEMKKGHKDILVGIRDQGLGIPMIYKKYIFHQFFRGASTFHEQTQGAGLGLYVSRLIVENRGGKIWFETEKDNGTTFYFSLPIK